MKIVNKKEKRSDTVMKRAKRLTREQKIYISSKRLKAENWLLQEETENGLILKNKESGKLRTILK